MSNQLCFKHLILILGLLFTISHARATEEENETGLGGAKGRISTSDNKPAAMVSVVLKGTRKNALSADDSSFIIRNIQPGNYTI